MTDADLLPLDNGLPAELSLEQWPHTVGSSACLTELQELVRARTHSINALPAYNRNGQLIKPNDYVRELKGATVVVHFTLSHWAIGGREQSDTFNPDVVNIKVLIPPTPDTASVPKTPVKRNALTDPFASIGSSPSPSKKTRSNGGR